MKITTAIVAILASSWAFAQETSRPASESKLEVIHAVKTTASVQGEDYTVARDENGKIMFVKTEVKEKFVSPILIQFEQPKNN